MALRGFSVSFGILLRDHSRTSSVLRGNLALDCLKSRDGAKRSLLSEDVVKLQDFQQRKLAAARQMSRSKDYYFDTVNQKIQKNEIILTDELKLILHICQCAEDVIIARNAIYRYHNENCNMAFGEFRFGPLFMRLCYELGLEELASATVKDPALKGFFSDSTSFNIAIDMLFNKGSYENAEEILEVMKKQRVPFNKDTFTLACALCYKLNTAKSYNICLDLLEDGQSNDSIIPRHAYCFATALALKQNDFERAKKIFSHIMNTDSRLCQNLKILVLAMTGSFAEALSTLTASLESNTTVLVKKPEFSKEVVTALWEKSASGLWQDQVARVVLRLEESGQVTERTLDDYLCHTPTGKRRPLALMEPGRKSSRRTFRPLQASLLSE